MSGIILDTNVVSALFHERENENVKRWFTGEALDNLYLTSIVFAEIVFGVRRVPAGRRRTSLDYWLRAIIYPNFAARLLSFDRSAAEAWADITAAGQSRGRPRPIMDSLTASIAQANGYAIATRNIQDFSGLGIDLVNPFGAR